MKKSKKAWLTFVTVSSWVLAQLGLPTAAQAWAPYSDDLQTLDHTGAVNLNKFKGTTFKSKDSLPQKQIINKPVKHTSQSAVKNNRSADNEDLRPKPKNISLRLELKSRRRHRVRKTCYGYKRTCTCVLGYAVIPTKTCEKSR